jgi:hypothetical protein
VAAIQAHRKASQMPAAPDHSARWVALAGASLFAGALLAGGLGWAVSQITSDSTLGAQLFGIGTLVLWGALLGTAFRGVGFKNPWIRAVVFGLVGIFAFVVEALIGAFLVVSFFPAYLLAAGAVIGFVLWISLGRRGTGSGSDSSTPQ